jgi:hypothetical protein
MTGLRLKADAAAAMPVGDGLSVVGYMDHHQVVSCRGHDAK